MWSGAVCSSAYVGGKQGFQLISLRTKLGARKSRPQKSSNCLVVELIERCVRNGARVVGGASRSGAGRVIENGTRLVDEKAACPRSGDDTYSGVR